MRLRRQLAIPALAALLLCLLAGDAAAKPRSALAPGSSLLPGQSLLAGSAKLTMRRNGDLALFYVPLRAGTPLAKRAKAKPPGPGCRTRRCRFLRPRQLWHSGSGGHPGARLTMRADGAAVVRAGGRVLWSSRTHRRGAWLRLRPRGDLAVLMPAGATASAVATASWSEAEAEVLWHSSTEVPTYAGSELAPGRRSRPASTCSQPMASTSST